MLTHSSAATDAVMGDSRVCDAHAAMYANVYNDLIPWRSRGIQRDDFKLCATLAIVFEPRTPEHDSVKTSCVYHTADICCKDLAAHAKPPTQTRHQGA